MLIKGLKDLAAVIRAERSYQGLTQVQTAGLCGVGTRFVSDLENGKETVHFGKVMQVIQGLGLEISILEKIRNDKGSV